MASNSFSVNSLLNTAQADDSRLTPLSSTTESSGRRTAVTSSANSPQADFSADGTASPPVSLHSSPGRALLPLPRRTGMSPQTQAPVQLPAIAIPAPVAAYADGSGTSPRTPVGPAGPAPLARPMPAPGSSSVQQHFRLRDYHHQLYRHQARHPHEAPQHSPPHSTSGVVRESHIRHQPPAVDYRFWPYPQPPHMGVRASHQGAFFIPPAPAPPPPVLHAGGVHTPWRRERRSKACLRCHTKKIKCEGEGSTCDGCRQAGCECKWVEMKKRGPKPKKKTAQTESGADEAHKEPPAVANETPNRTLPALIKPMNGKISEAAASGTISGSSSASTIAQPTVLTPPPPPPPKPESSSETIAEPKPEPPAAAATGAEPELETATMEQVLQRFQSEHVAQDTREAVEFYFDYLYGRIPVFHPASFVRRVAFGQVDELLLDVMKACTARLITKRTGRAIDVAALTASVHRRLLAGLDRPTMDYVRAVLLAASQSGGESRFTTYNSLASLAASLVMRLGWHTLDLGRSNDDVPWSEWVELEEKRRTFWAVYQLDSYQSLMSDRPMTIDRSRICIAPPGSDCTWEDVTMPQILHWPTRHQAGARHDVVVRMGALSYAFIELCSLLAIVAQINDFLWDVRVHVLVRLPGREWAADIPYMPPPPPPALHAAREPVASMFEYPEFRRLHDALCEWRDTLIRAEDMREGSAALRDFSQLGSLENRRFSMRVRFFSLRCYLSAFLLMLHATNRPSFFDPARQLPRRAGSLVASVAVTEREEDRALRGLLSSAFSELLNDGFLAYDIVDESWELCLQEIYQLMDHLERNSDIPIDRCDSSISFCLFTSITVLVRQIRMCREAIERTPEPARAAACAARRDELARAGSTLRRMWRMLKDLGFIWGARGMEHLLRTMQVEEIANAADMLGGLKLTR
ncbi:hypothetical protein LPJ63_001990 [Coemansia sp. RSA 2711]|nr:hypothetical protein LPJ63_001990 [Coemansia sp. RSA 2711]